VSSLQLGIPIFILAALVQATVLSHVRVYGGQPDLIVIIVLAWAILDRDQEGMVWAFVGGLFLDLLSGTPLGISSLALVPVAFLVGLTEAQVYRENVGLPLLMASGGALAYHILYLLLLRFFADMSVPWSEALVYVTLPSIVFDVILVIPAVRILGRWYKRLHPRQVRI
jgi:rod shape-determining protein MreD